MRTRHLIFGLLGTAAGAIFGCQPQAALVPCTSTAQCGINDVCIKAGYCAPPCTATGTCGTGETCSTEKACVGPDGLPVIQGGTGSGGSGGPGGTGGAGGTGGSGGAGGVGGSGGSGDGGVSTCGAELFASTRLAANMLMMLDRSGSMKESAGKNSMGVTVSKWKSAQDALTKVATSTAGKIFMGLATFPTNGSSTSCGDGQILVPIGPSTSSSIASQLTSATADGKTPLGGALQLAGAQASLKDTTRANYVLFITDGMETCGGDVITEVKKLFAAGIKTYVVGFGTGVDGTVLSNVATHGGTARPTGTKYYQANDPVQLEAALDSIAAGAVGCDYKLGKAPPDVSKIYVYVGGVLQARDMSHATGWDYNATANKITLYGATCQTVSTNPNTSVNIVYGCPDQGLGEVTPPATDGGVFQ